jgi:alkylation response protein AidB-like acyl-CoA dehydrogenase
MTTDTSAAAASIAPGGFRASARAWLSANRVHAPALGSDLTPERVESWRAWSRRLSDAGFAGVTWPVPYGGRGLPPSYQGIWLEELAFARVPDHLGIIGLGMAGPTIMACGSDEQKSRLLPPILDCSEIWCQGFSEPGAGSDLAAVQTTAILADGHWLVNGQKVWSSFAHIADWCLLVTRTDPSAEKHRGLSFLLADLHQPGVTVRPLRQITGDPEFNEIFFDDVRVPREQMLGEPGDGWRVAMTTLAHERGTYGTGLASSLDMELRSAVDVLSAKLGPQAPLDDPVVRDQLVQVWVELQALIRTNQRVMAGMDKTGVPGPEATVSKLRWSLLNQRITSIVTDTLGARGLERGADGYGGGHWSYARLRARGNTIEAGTTEVLRNIIAERVLSLPRSR